MPPRRRPNLGWQKIETKRIENQQARQVTFSKRRFGLFKKASSLSVLCGVELAAVIFSPGGKAFSFGSPSVDAVINRLIATFFANNNNANTAPAAAGGGGAGSSSSAPAATGGGRGSSSAPAAEALVELNKVYEELRAMMEEEKRRKERAEEEMKRERSRWQYWRPRRFANSVYEVGGSSGGNNNGGFANNIYEVSGSSGGNNNGGFANSVYEVGGSSVGNNNGGAAAMEEMMQQLYLMGQIRPLPPPGMGQIPPPPPVGMGQIPPFLETMDLPPPPGMGQLSPFPGTMYLPLPELGPDGGFFLPGDGFFGPPPY
ncbi:MADS-box protein JOINTLESS-like [Brachypodium distachyon]|uniref:MADS-box transcription factor 47 n=1 Tax=Brachypodium distachyon TaxID=15368 RepID=I1HJR6_BRADI|nr:MADS-box protein JOINTLESS-like [Brachypodium distachyon]AIG21855.1 MADS-box transcription factor 47 [Brachypodium distachyon]KQK06427.1 hypothetical protein BRADI_2g26320v3 [Brachypodium distachyon]|eukprot:NP_001304796.1 MADS-box protein JOINTLESS-like [Brachypodium distachyon]